MAESGCINGCAAPGESRVVQGLPTAARGAWVSDLPHLCALAFAANMRPCWPLVTAPPTLWRLIVTLLR